MNPGQQPPLPTGFHPLRPGDPLVVGPFHLVGLLGEGGMGTVYGALGGDGEHVALKVVRDRHAADPVYREQFAREAAVLARVSAECAPRFLGADPGAERPWMATEFVTGRTLTDHLAQLGPLSGERLLAFAAGTAEALAAVHAAGITHRDVKPANVILSPDGPKLLDFGIARLTEDPSPEEGVFGSPGWIAPERLAGEVGTPKADVFAWGGLVVHAATGHGPFGRGDTATLLARTRRGEVDAEGVPDELLPLVLRALSPDPDARPTAFEAFEELLALGRTAPEQDPRTRLRVLLAASWTGFEAVRGLGRWAAVAGALGAATGSAAAGAGATGAAGGGAAAGTATGAGGTATGGATTATATASAAAGGVTGVGKTVAAGAAITVLVGAGAWVAGQWYADREEEGPVVEAAASEPEPSGEPVQEVAYRGMTLELPEDWGVERRTYSFEYVPTGETIEAENVSLRTPEADADCTADEQGETLHCPSVRLLGPEAVTYRQGQAPVDGTMPFMGGGLDTCPAGAEPRGEGEIEEVTDGLAPVGERTAHYRVWAVPCFPEGAGTAEEDLRWFEQRYWLLPESEILIVDDYTHEGLEEILAGADLPA
ncbi:serine/threonine-protein kinase [Nocardiopsis changdeensis]|uniref:Serine/threonine protein kinase n=1 Tax=Nocardiopsis changdeensis TaxID=2831969 RepID=A0ABX8BLA4_9ACTN|nr:MULTISPECIES: serine/threonine-protein kinase [Nocardiopsis]QUX22323.1 serine/threonine protein kinase [Nocardiopsis changdeensis]QYX38264.1 serine/threonine protein kinase [Nocardiopsis sp. MT53]